MKKILILLLILPLLLCSCATGDISCGVDGENNAFLFLSLQADWSGATDDMKEEIRRGFIAIADHFENKLGFEVEQSITKVSADLNMRLVRPAATPEEAFQELESILTDEALTPFTEVKMQMVPGEHFSGYRVDVTLDAAGFLSAMSLDHFPASLAQYITQSISDSQVTMQLTLPGEEAVASSVTPTLENGVATVSSPVSFTETTSLSLTTATNTSGETAESLESQVKSTQTRLWIFGGLLVLFVAGLVVSIFCMREKNPADYDW
ncbi:MAG: hypothetical protein IJF34_04665 [Clostridia bacterium]|nr:hypothetical protein [Clostridia bacterium]